MVQLADVMLNTAELMFEFYREPAVTAYNRLEARPRAHDFTRSLRAEVRDPLWMLTRQWQLGEFTAEDAGTPVDARLATRRLSVDRVQLGGGSPQVYDDSVPLEAAVEREQVPFTHALRVQAAQYFLRLHTDVLRQKYLPQYKAQYPLAQGAEAEFRGQVDGLNFYVATRRASFDGEQVLVAIDDGSFFADIAIDAADLAEMQRITGAFALWLQRQYLQPSAEAPAVWDSSRLSYPVKAAATGEDDEQVVLGAPRYPGGRLDWYSFEVEDAAADLEIPDDGYVPPPPVDEAISFLPVPASFKGMPNPRYWEFEERQVNFGALDAQTTDHLLLVFAELGLVYGNDWYVVPYSMPVNTLCEVRSLIVTDVFGDRLLIEAADEGDGNDWRHWSIFGLSNRDQPGSNVERFFLPSAVGAAQESEALERVQFARDEMANMVWAVEEVIPDATAHGINGHDAADKTAVLPDVIENSPASIRYVLGTTVPENWIPFVPVRRPGTSQDITFQRAAMPAMGVPPREIIRAKGVLLNEPGLPWFINEEDVPFTGTEVARSYQRVRWYDGRTFVWIGRQRQTGRGVGGSNLRFDQIEPTESA